MRLNRLRDGFRPASNRRLALSVAVLLASVAVPGEAHPTEFDCVIEPHQTVNLASPVVGVVERLDVDRGDIVKRGQVIGKLQDGVERAALALAQTRASDSSRIGAAEARLRYLRSQQDRLEKLQSKDIASRSALQKATEEANVAEHELETAKFDKQVAALQVEQTRQVLDRMTLHSPIDGIVVERLLVPGEYRNEQSPIMKLAQLDPLRVEVFVPTAYYGQIQTGNGAIVVPEEPIGGNYEATVDVVDRVLDAASGTFGVRLLLPNKQLQLPGGIRCKVRFELG